jgi:hypothetical protein
MDTRFFVNPEPALFCMGERLDARQGLTQWESVGKRQQMLRITWW